MKILIWSDRDEFLTEIVWKLHKEKHEVYIIYNEGKKSQKKMKGAFEEYYISYGSNHISTVVRNVSPDVCLFLQDVVPRLGDRNSYISYVTGLTNAIMSTKYENVNRFYYRSSVLAYQSNRSKIIDEKALPKQGSSEVNNILACEQLCLMNKEDTFHPIILRFGEVMQAKAGMGVGSFVSECLYAYLHGKNIRVSKDRYHNCIYVKDACEALYRVILSEEDKVSAVIVASEESYDEKTIADMICKYLPVEIENVELDASMKNYRFESEVLKRLRYSQRYDLQQSIEIISQSVIKEEKHHANEKKREKFWVPYVETFCFFLLAQLFIMLTSKANFHDVIDMYLMFSLWVASVHGVGCGVTSVILSVIARSMLGTDYLELTGVQFYYWCVQLLSLTVLGGYVKDSFKRQKQDDEDAREYLEYELDYYRQLNENGQEIKQIYEERLLNYKDSFAKIADIISGLDELEAQKVIFDTVGVVERTLKSKKVCIYLVDERSGFARLMASSDCFEGKGKTFNVKDYPEILEVLNEGEVYINRELDDEWPIFMKGIMNDGKLSAIIMVYELDFKNMDLQTSNTFSMLCNLIEGSMRRAYTYLTGIRQELYYENSQVMKWEAFSDILELYIYGEGKNLQEFSLLRIRTEEQTLEEIQKGVRKTDYLGKKDDEYYYLILSNTKEEEAMFVMERYLCAGISALIEKKNRGNSIEEVFPSI